MGSRINSLVPGAKPEKRGFAKMWEKKAQDIGVDDSTSRVGSLVSHSRTIDPNYDIELQGNNWLAVPASLEGIVVRTEVQHRVEATRRPIKATSHTQRVIQNQLNGRAGSDPGPEIHNGIMTVIEREDGFQFEPT